jgi:hypothetical protein
MRDLDVKSSLLKLQAELSRNVRVVDVRQNTPDVGLISHVPRIRGIVMVPLVVSTASS